MKDIWSTLPPTPRKPFGCALSPEQRGEIVKPMLITEQPRFFTCPELRKIIDGEKE